MAFRPFFMASSDFAESVIDLFDSVWPCAAAMWNLRWQVKGFVAETTDATDDALRARFIEGSGIKGANLRRACISHNWTRQQGFFARVVLVNLIAHYEAWCKSIGEQFAKPPLANSEDQSAAIRRIEMALQAWGQPGDAYMGIVQCVQSLKSRKSPTLAASFGVNYLCSERYSPHRLEALMRCFRFFKELRNCLAHHGGRADVRLLKTFQLWQPHATSANFGANDVVKQSIPSLGSPCSIDLRAVVGFGDVLFDIVATVDAMLVDTTIAETDLFQRWRGEGESKMRIRRDKTDAKSKICGAAGRIGIMKPIVTPALISLLRQHGLVVIGD